MRRIRLMWVLSLAVLLGSSGCASNVDRDSVLNPMHWMLHIWKIADEFHEFRVDIDRTIFDLDHRPVEEMDM